MSALRELRRKLAVYVLVTPIALMPVHANAGLKEAMNEIFASTSTNPQAFQTQRLRGIYGGSMTLRPVGKPISIAQFAAPSIDAGCGGIDLFFGSFSYINGEQFEQLLRSIASAAVGYAVKAAIGSMCNPCAAIIEALEEGIRQLNSLAKNTCAIGKQIADRDIDGLIERGRKIGTAIATAYNRKADQVAAENDSMAKKNSEVATGGGGSAGADDNSAVGNIVFKAAEEAYNNGANPLKVFLSNKQAIEVVMALYGTQIVLPNAVKESSGSSACGAGAAAERCENKGHVRYPTIVSLAKFVNPDADGLPVYTCGDSKCSTMVESTMTKSEWGGVNAFLNEAMFGVAEPAVYMSYTEDSLAGYIIHKGVGSLSTKARALLTIAPLPILTYLMEVQRWPTAVESLSHQMVAGLAPHFEYQLAAAAHAAAMNAFTVQEKAQMPEVFLAYLKARGDELSTLRPKGNDLAALFNSINQSVIAMQTLMSQKIQVK